MLLYSLGGYKPPVQKTFENDGTTNATDTILGQNGSVAIFL